MFSSAHGCLRPVITRVQLKSVPDRITLPTLPNNVFASRDASSSSSVELTANRHPELKRGDYATLEPSDVAAFRGILDDNRVLTDPDDLLGYNTDWLSTVRGQGRLVLKPRNTSEVSRILKHCSARRLAVCPQGGNTGMVGGSVPVFDEVVVSTSLMNRVEDLDLNSSVVTVQAGVVLEQLDHHLSQHQLMVPLDLGAKGSCQIGGNVSTNAGGIRLLRYGNLHGSVMGLEAVLADGQILDCLCPLKKDNTGYDLKHLFIGSEGTLGLVTRVTLHCPPRPKSVNLAFLALESFQQVLETFKMARSDLGEILSSCEFLDAGSMECVTKNLGLTCKLGEQPFYMIIETSGSQSSHDEEKLSGFLESLMTSGRILDGTVAASSGQMTEIWPLRERLAEALLVDGYSYKYDISLPMDVFYDIVPLLRRRLGSSIVRCVGYGHIGDGNLHLNITSKQYDQAVLDAIEPFLYEWTSKQRGSISAEHGLGLKKRNYIHFSKSASAIHLMRMQKQMMDPHGILNPYKVLPDQP